MVRAGLLGWLLFLPVGEADLPGWSALCVAAGFFAAFYGVLVGLTQENPKTVLAYSTISQMGLMTVGAGAALTVPQALPLALAAVAVYTAHHALAKGALFLGVGVSEAAGGGWPRVLVVVGLLPAALALAGAPLTSGAAAKAYLKTAKEPLAAPWPAVKETFLQLGAVGTTVLMGRFLRAAWPRSDGESDAESNAESDGGHLSVGLWLPWAVLLAAVATLVVLLPDDVADTLDLIPLLQRPVAGGGRGRPLLCQPARRPPARPGLRSEDPRGRLAGAGAQPAGLHGTPLWASRLLPGWKTLGAKSSFGMGRLYDRASPRAPIGRAEGPMFLWTVAASLFAVLTLALLVLIWLG